MDLETIRYELLPYLYGAGGIVALSTTPGSLLLKSSGVLLVGAALITIRLRWVYRRTPVFRLPNPSATDEVPGNHSQSAMPR